MQSDKTDSTNLAADAQLAAPSPASARLPRSRAVPIAGVFIIICLTAVVIYHIVHLEQALGAVHHEPYALMVGVIYTGAPLSGVAEAPVSVAPRSAKTAGAGVASATVHGDIARGNQLFHMTCHACHGVEGQGIPGLGVNLRASAFIFSQPDTALVAFIKAGRLPTDPTHLAMPPKGANPDLDDASLRDIVAFLRTLQSKLSAAGTPAGASHS